MHNEQIDELSHASSDDEAALAWPVPDRVFGFLAQQAIEKQLKMLILANRKKPEFIHDISQLVGTLHGLGETLPALPYRVSELTDFAAQFRYTTPRLLTLEDREQILQSIRILREHVHARLVALDA